MLNNFNYQNFINISSFCDKLAAPLAWGTNLFLVVMGPDPTQAYFWPTVNKMPTCLWTNLKHPVEKKLENLIFLGKIFPALA